jgi:hypothetical protein
MPAEYLLPWSCEEPEEGSGKAPRSRKVKYTCPGCSANVWGQPDPAVVCADCDAPFAEEDAD